MPAKLKRSAKTSGGVLCSKEAMNGLISKRAVGLLGSHLSSVGNPAPPPRPDDVDDSFLDDDLDFVGSTM